MTISVWAKFPPFEEGGGGVLVSNRKDKAINYQFNYGVFRHNDLRNCVLGLRRVTAGPEGLVKSGQCNLEPHQWHHLVVTHDGSTARFYVNGKLFDQKPSVQYQGTTADGELVIGVIRSNDDFDGRRLDGILDEIIILSRALPDREVQAMYEQTMP